LPVLSLPFSGRSFWQCRISSKGNLNSFKLKA
jgi:hypothetical protein